MVFLFTSQMYKRSVKSQNHTFKKCQGCYLHILLLMPNVMKLKEVFETTNETTSCLTLFLYSCVFRR